MAANANYPAPGNNPDVNWQAFVTALGTGQPALDFSYTWDDNDAVKGVLIWPRNAGESWGKGTSHIHLICVPPANGNVRAFIKPQKATCTLRRYAGFVDQNGWGWQLRFPIGDYPKNPPQQGIWNVRGVLTFRVEDPDVPGGKMTRFKRVCRFWRVESTAPQQEKDKWSVAWTNSVDGGQVYQHQWETLLDRFQDICDQIMGPRGWNLRY